MKFNKKLFLTLLTGVILCTGTEFLWAGSGTKGYNFLTLGVGARPVGMGEAFVGVSDDVHALVWNPAGLVKLKNPVFSMTHLEWVAQVKQENFIWAIPIGKTQAIGGGINYLHTQMISNRDNVDNEEVFYFSDLALTLSYARKLDRDLMAGVSVKLIREAISVDSLSSLAVAFDAGLIVGLSDKFSLGLCAQNVGIGITALKDNKDALPITLRGGIGYKSFTGSRVIAFDVEKPLDGDFYLHSGAEFNQKRIFRGVLSERIGYVYRLGSGGNSWGFLSGLRAGFGFETAGGLQIDYAFQPFTSEIGYTHRVSLNLKFSARKRE
ncbi:MAG: PorV/PorQ family protein [bacterium]